MARLEPDRDWDDLVLPPAQLNMLRQICAGLQDRSESGHADNGGGDPRPGMTVLFAGEPGTGKTTAARLLGAELGRGLVRVDLVRLNELEPELMRRALEGALRDAARSNTIVFMDGVDALFAKRKHVVGSREPDFSSEAAEVVRSIEEHPGLIVLASQLNARLEDDLLERMDHTVDFPFPDAPARAELWRRTLPDTAEVDDAVVDFLSTSFRLTGGAIVACVAFASRRAAAEGGPITTRQIVDGLETGYRGRLLHPRTQEAIDQLRRMSPGPRPNAAPTPPPPPPPTPPPAAPASAATSPPAPARVPAPGPTGPPAAHAPLPPPDVQPTRRPPVVPRSQPPAPTASTAPPRRPSAPPPPPPPVRATGPVLPARVVVPARDQTDRRFTRLVLGFVVVAAAIGFALARSGGGASSPAAPHLSRLAVSGSLRVSYPGSWRRVSPPAPSVLGLVGAVALAPPQPTTALLVIGREASASLSAPLTPTVLRAIAHLQTAQLTNLGGYRFYRYPDQSIGGVAGPVTLYALPTSKGTLMAFCKRGDGGTAVEADCQRIVATLRPASGAVLTVNPSNAYVSQLRGAIAKLNSARVSGAAALARAHTVQAQAAAANALAAAHFTAAASILRLSTGHAFGVGQTLVVALRNAGSAYRALARAAASHNAPAYATARKAVASAATRLAAAASALS